MGHKKLKNAPWYRKQTDTWYITIDGHQVPLAKGKKNEASAMKAWHEIMVKHDAPRTGDDNELKTIFELYLEGLTKRAEPKTIVEFTEFFKDFCRTYPGLTVNELKPYHLENWVALHDGWKSTNSRHRVMKIIKIALNWAASAKSGNLITKNPLRGIEMPPTESRGTESLIDLQLHDYFIQNIPKYLQDVIITLRHTGTRPINISRVTAQEFFPNEKVFRLLKHKTGSKGKVLDIYLTDTVVEICKRLAIEHPEGPLFLTKEGLQWDVSNLATMVRYYCNKLKIPRLICYGYRHTLATELLSNGEDDAVVAHILGHSNTNTLHKHYSHLTAKTKKMVNILDNNVQPTQTEKNSEQRNNDSERGSTKA